MNSRSPKRDSKVGFFKEQALRVKKKFRKVLNGDEFYRIRDEVPKILKEKAAVVRSKWRKVVTGDESKRVREFIREKESEPKYIRLFDKLAFTQGVLNVCIFQYFLLNQPKYYWLCYSIVVPIFMATRIYHFKSLGWEYFLFDFCYFVVGLTLINIFFVPNSEFVSRILFIFTNGPLTAAILVWRNSFVFHDFDRITSVYVHLLPSMLSYTSRWYGHGAIIPSWFSINETCTAMNTNPECISNPMSTTHVYGKGSLTLRDFVCASLVYLFWQFCYYVKTEIVDKSKLDSCPQLLTSLRWLSSDTKNTLARLILKGCRAVRIFGPSEDFDSTTAKTKIVFMFSQFVYTLVTFIPTWFLYESQSLHIIYIMFIFTSSVYNAASFYIEVFSKRYQSQFAPISAGNPTGKPSELTDNKKSHEVDTSKANANIIIRSNINPETAENSNRSTLVQDQKRFHNKVVKVSTVTLVTTSECTNNMHDGCDDVQLQDSVGDSEGNDNDEKWVTTEWESDSDDIVNHLKLTISSNKVTFADPQGDQYNYYPDEFVDIDH